MKEYIHLDRQDFTIIGKNAKLKGPVEFEGITHVCGEISGEIKVRDNSPLTIESVGIVNGEVQCHDIEIYGTVEGEITSSGKISIYPSAKVSGGLKAKKLVIHPGAAVNIKGHAESTTPA